MKSNLIYSSIFLMGFIGLAGCGEIQTRPENKHLSTMQTSTSVYDFTLISIDGKDLSLAQFKGKKMLLVNTASECGNTPQYAELEELHKKYADKVEVLGFPANNFGGQEPGSNQDIQSFCTKNYGVTFTMFEKISVKGSEMAPLYKWLSTKELNGWNDTQPDWNFAKYLINEKGELIKFFPASLSPMSDEILKCL
ncbi:MAG: glutathione peroxidase [Bacteroidetes bacterium]|nr:glutathione peroxidase [Bacteroidota bacterium]